MAKYGLSVYGVGVYGADSTSIVAADFSVDPFLVTPSGYGSAALSWTYPAGAWSVLRVVRSSRGNPADELDGQILFNRDNTPATPAATDTGLTPGHWYYYSLFLYDTTSSSWVRSATASVLIPTDYGYTKRLADLLPSVWKAQDLQGIGSTEIDEDSSLYRFLSVFGYGLDIARSGVESLLSLGNPAQLSESMLPAALAQYGFSYEPQLGTSAMRKLLRNAVRLYQLKGTVAGIEEFITTATGWPATISIGKNLALDEPMAGMSGGIGLWASDPQSITVAYRASDGTIAAPVGEGMVAATVTGTTSILSMQLAATGNPATARLSSIPVTEGVQYTASIYLWAAAGVPTTATPALTIVWLDSSGTVLGTSADALAAIGTDGAWHRLVQTGTAPASARYALISTSMNGSFTSGMKVYWSGFQFEAGAAATSWECARKVRIALAADLTNEITNPNGAIDTTGWSTIDTGLTVSSSADAPSFSWTFPSTGRHWVDAPCGRVAVRPGEVWTFMVEVKGTTAEQLQLGLRRIYGGYTRDGVVGGVPSPLSTSFGDVVTASTSFVQYRMEYTVPLDGSVQEIQPLLYWDAATSGHVAEWRHASLQRASADGAAYFDGSTASSTNDYIWEGATNASRSLRFRRRSVKVARLTDLLPDFMLMQSCYELDYTGPVQHSPVYLTFGVLFATAEALAPITDSFTRADADLTAPWVELI